MPSLTTWAPFCAMVLPMWTMLSPWSKQSHGCSCQGCKATNHIGTLRNLPNPNTHQNSPEPSGTCLWNLHQHTPEPSGTFRNLSPEPTPAYAGTLRNLPEPASGNLHSTHRSSPEPSGTRLRNLHSTHRSSPEPSGTFLRNLFLRPAPTHTGAYLGWRPH